MGEPLEHVDRAGSIAGLLCAAHCALSALLPTAMAALGVGFLLSHEVELALTLLALALGTLALRQSWRRRPSPRIAVLFLVGLVGLVAARLLEGDGHAHEAHHGEQGVHAPAGHEEPHEPPAAAALGIAAGLALAAGHLLSLRAAKASVPPGDPGPVGSR